MRTRPPGSRRQRAWGVATFWPKTRISQSEPQPRKIQSDKIVASNGEKLRRWCFRAFRISRAAPTLPRYPDFHPAILFSARRIFIAGDRHRAAHSLDLL